ncbi:hypothetical protein ABPG77_000277 [Micractinium sp. CCAP 211/92]
MAASHLGLCASAACSLRQACLEPSPVQHARDNDGMPAAARSFRSPLAAGAIHDPTWQLSCASGGSRQKLTGKPAGPPATACACIDAHGASAGHGPGGECFFCSRRAAGLAHPK